MSRSDITVCFEAVLTRSSGSFEWIFLPVTRETVAKFGFEGNTRRVVCTIDSAESFHCGLLPDGRGGYFITVNKPLRDRLNIREGSTVNVELKTDNSKYGMPMPEEMQEVLNQDPEGDRLFHALTPGKQRTLLHAVTSVKDVDKRIHRALIILKHLSDNNGKLDYTMLYEALKRPLL